MGKYAEVTGFVNTTFIRDRVTGVHHLVEFDTRANAWHFLANKFGLDIASFYLQKNCPRLQENSIPPKKYLMRDRYIFYLTKRLGILDLFQELWKLNKSEIMLVSPDGVVNNITFLECINVFSRVLIRKLYRKSPSLFQYAIKNYLKRK